MLSYGLHPWSGLSGSDRGAWTAFRAANPSLRSPYFDLGYCDALAAAHCDLHVLRIQQGGVVQAFLPLHRSRSGMAYPAGGPLSDWHGFVAPPEGVVDAAAALRAVGLAGYRFENTPAADRALAPHATERTGSHLIDLSAGPQAWWGRRKRALRGLGRHERKLAQDGRRVAVTLDDRSPEALAALFAWKSEQLRITRQFDLFSLPWTRSLVTGLHHARQGPFRGLLSSLRIDGELAAVHFGMMSGGVLHYWFPAYDQAAGRYGPGGLLLRAMAMGAEALGVVEIDLGKGEYRYKREFADAEAPLVEGLVATSVGAGALKMLWAASAGVARWPLSRGADLPRRALRRLDRGASLRSVVADPRRTP